MASETAIIQGSGCQLHVSLGGPKDDARRPVGVPTSLQLKILRRQDDALRRGYADSRGAEFDSVDCVLHLEEPAFKRECSRSWCAKASSELKLKRASWTKSHFAT